MNIAFFGTSDKTGSILEALKNCFDLKLCLTKKNSIVGRKKEIRETQVKKWAISQNIDYYCIESIREEEDKLISLLHEYQINLAVVADFDFIISQRMIESVKYGFINIHFSLLPKLRGASPVQHAILEGLGYTGITYFLLDKGMDTGEILSQLKVDIYQSETAGELMIRLFDLAANKLPDVITNYSQGKIKPQKQDNSKATYCYSKTKPTSTLIYKEDAFIDWDDNVNYIERQIRAYNPWPISWTTLDKMHKNNKISEQIELKEISKNNLRVKIYQANLQSDKLAIKRLQIEGKNITDWESFKNGYTIKK